MIPLLAEGTAGLQAIIEKSQKMAPVTAEMAAQADLFNDRLAELKVASSSLGVSLTNGLDPCSMERKDESSMVLVIPYGVRRIDCVILNATIDSAQECELEGIKWTPNPYG